MSDQKFIYLLNAFEAALQDESPAKCGYGEKRRAVLEYVERLEREAERLRHKILTMPAGIDD